MNETEEMSESSPPPSSLSSSSAKKKRNANFSRDEVYCLVMEYGKRLNVLTFGNRDQKHKCWEEITGEINNLHSDFKRNVDEIKKKWIDLLYATKKEYVKATKEAAAAGEGSRRKLSEISELIVKVRGGFSNKRSCIGGATTSSKKQENGVHIINLQIPNADCNEHPTTIYIPHVDECQSSASESMQDGSPQHAATAVMIPAADAATFADAVNEAEATVIDSVTGYHNYTQSANLQSSPVPLSPAQGNQCSCGLSADIVRLKQETLGVLRRQIQIEEERRIEEKQKWWEEKSILRLKRQKLELEIKQLQQNIVKHSPDYKFQNG